MAALASPTVRQALRVAGYVLLTLLVYWVNAVTPSTARFGIRRPAPVCTPFITLTIRSLR